MLTTSNPALPRAQPSEASAGSSPALRALTGLRFFAAAHVIWFHYGQQATVEDWRIERVRAFGWTAVSLFFLLSGFLLAYRYEGLGEDRVSRARFFWARAARIWPAHLLALSLTVSLQLANEGSLFAAQPWWRQLWTVLLNALLLQNWAPVEQLNVPTWSLSVEVFLYLCFPWLLRVLRGRSLAGQVGLALGAWLTSWGVFALVFGVASARSESALPWQERWGIWLSNLPPLRLPAFVLGMLLGLWFLRSSRRAHKPEWAGAALTWAGLLLAGGTLAFFPRGWPGQEALLPLLLPGQALLVWGLAHGGGWLGRALSLRPVVWLGDCSYAMYVFQLPVVLFLYRVGWVSSVQEVFFLYVLGLWGLSAGVFSFWERPARAALQRLGERSLGALGASGPAR